ncbi:S-adenosyl-L-methionine-dependent methyltransferase [Podospora fimiseda]|uniref:Ubiquinone biosynthesis O-methyltransferase, mitochondrial n=1 Tax=Podospora fimiseda TaxID=252190 RepID=A0AAN7H2V7_9PEZI|nr:S-adenosyl-L-methionine-dependent methyltransferase [Podospora fimiseda]
MRSSLRPARRAAAVLLRPTRTLNNSFLQQSRPYSSSSSVNPTEICHFSALASSWWEPHGPSRPLHLMNPLRHDFIRLCYNSPTPPSTFLDVGCGGGIFAESAARLPTTTKTTAIDPSTTILSIARQHAKKDPSLFNKLNYINSSIETLQHPKVDVVSCFEVVEHVDYPSEFLDKLGEFVRPGGWLVMSTIARTWTSWFTTNLVAEDILGMVPKGTHDWNKYINEHELRAYFEKRPEKWGEIKVMGVVFVPGCGWKEVKGSEKIGNYFLGVQRIA